ncbi:MAG: hypothetical protein NZ772_14605, partial [Cyanobacteria bacterium]|nr:hypothetical protein [Cyanobacteriota bacterium]MDW8202604.1 hypothetical protein [Cyanobacteriota bacterium SKYGB_h_bin112]
NGHKWFTNTAIAALGNLLFTPTYSRPLVTTMDPQSSNSTTVSSKLRAIVSIGLFIILSIGVLFLSGNLILALIHKFTA